MSDRVADAAVERPKHAADVADAADAQVRARMDRGAAIGQPRVASHRSPVDDPVPAPDVAALPDAMTPPPANGVFDERSLDVH